jgi:alpha-glucosidase
VPELTWFDELPVVWDETRVLESDMDSFATIARRQHNRWFVGSLNGNQERTLRLKMEFLPKNRRFQAVLYTDDKQSVPERKVVIRNMELSSTTVLEFTIAARGAVAISIRPI